MDTSLQIPSPLEKIEFSDFKAADVDVYLKRDDLIHPFISGNKWRKLKYNIENFKAAKLKGFVTFGGAYSNHLAAASYAASQHNLHMVAFVRGLDAETSNPTLDFVKHCGTKIIALSRSEYRNKHTPTFRATLQQDFPRYGYLPEGGANVDGVRGCAEIMQEINQPFDVIAAPLGSATTFAGLLMSNFPAQRYLGFPAVKGGIYLEEDVNNFIKEAINAHLLPSNFTPPAWHLETGFHFGGFGKVQPELIDFMNRFYNKTGVPLDPIYTAKMMFGLVNLIKRGAITPGTRLLAIHTGGLQGISGMNQRLRKKNLRIEYEEIVAHTNLAPPY